MDKSKARELFNKYIYWYRWAMQLQHWQITVEWGPTEYIDRTKNDNTMLVAHIRTDPDYHTATIRIDHDSIEDEDELHKILRHELLHIMHSEMDVLRRQLAQQASDVDLEKYDVVLDHVYERIVWRIERMFDLGLGMSPMDMISNAKRWYKDTVSSKPDFNQAEVIDSD